MMSTVEKLFCIWMCVLFTMAIGIFVTIFTERPKDPHRILNKVTHLLDLNQDLQEIVDTIEVRTKLRNYGITEDTSEEDLVFVSELLAVKTTHMQASLLDIVHELQGTHGTRITTTDR